ncbi:hypothetical protein PROFUN_09485 [Planoprotostelium fungivorum]|uniref:Uncharacterized protein n=1 Tax=Planoprotostelium fungivorum TaxID=1890364 RepID=A0A2P6NH40_9EUKA|nr:hypothetical protein PROFUN_09485 [Planoprotostelium fungivorum]
MSKKWITVTYTKKIAYIGTFLCYERPDEKSEYTTVIINDLVLYYFSPPPALDRACGQQQKHLSVAMQVSMATDGKVQSKPRNFQERMQESSKVHPTGKQPLELSFFPGRDTQGAQVEQVFSRLLYMARGGRSRTGLSDGRDEISKATEWCPIIN